jgi:hypothetical protein
VTEREENGLRAGLALLSAGYADYGGHLLRELAGEPAAPALALLAAGDPAEAIKAIREALSGAPAAASTDIRERHT